RLFVEELSGFIRRELNGELEMIEADEIRDLILEKTEYIESAFQISASLHRLKVELLGRFKEDLDRGLSAHGMSLVWDDEKLEKGQRCAGFGARLHPEHEAHLRFEFGGTQLSALEWGV